MPQAEKLTDEQIDTTYMHFEHGDVAPKGVKLAKSFTRTMGRYVQSGANGTRVVKYPS